MSSLAGAALVIGLIAAPSGADTGTLSLGQNTIAPGGSTTITGNFVSTSSSVAALVLRIAPQGGANGDVKFSDLQFSSSVGGWNCFIGANEDSAECLWSSGGGKTTGSTAQVSVTATASAGASGTFLVSAIDETLDPVVLDTAELQIGGGTTTTTTAPPAAPVFEAQPTFTG